MASDGITASITTRRRWDAGLGEPGRVVHPVSADDVAALMPELGQRIVRGGAMPGDRCPNATLWKSSCKSRGCPVCGPRWARNVQAQLAIGLEHAGVKVATIAITGPGADVLPWDDDYCAARGRRMPGHRHSGPKGCRVQPRPLREWCSTLTWRWQKLRQAARLATIREIGYAPWVLSRVWEPQKRGVPHLHLVVPYGTFAEKRAAAVFRGHLARLVAEYDFGHVQGKLQEIEGKQAARYLANYLAGRTGKKSSIRENIADPRLPASLVWLTPVLTSVSDTPRMVTWRERYGVRIGTGVTMRTLRRARHLWALARGYCDFHPAWESLEEAVICAIAFRRVYPERAGPPGDVEGALAYARSLDARSSYRRWLWNEFTLELDLNHDLFADLTRVAFLATQDPTWERPPAA